MSTEERLTWELSPNLSPRKESCLLESMPLPSTPLTLFFWKEGISKDPYPLFVGLKELVKWFLPMELMFSHGLAREWPSFRVMGHGANSVFATLHSASKLQKMFLNRVLLLAWSIPWQLSALSNTIKLKDVKEGSCTLLPPQELERL